MKLLRYLRQDGPRIGMVVGDGIVDIAARLPEYTEIRQIAAEGQPALDRIAAACGDAQPDLALTDATLLAPIERPGKYLAIGMNYAKHLAEADKLGVARAPYQTWFNKQTTCVVGPYDDIDQGVTEKLDYEVELAAVIGKPAKYVSEADAPAHIFGYTVANDVSARDWQFHTPTFTMGKSFDTHGPIGPWIVTADEIPDPHNLGLRCYVNGEKRQDSNTSQLINDLWAQIAYLSQAFTLETGDLIATGTPEGVGVGMDPQVFLQPGDVVRCEVDGIGAIQNTVVAKK
jgi:2-keto-4-pentenoate hydratase/2-oxohepta-3-ene-1,7-dioic acid hydratase in catechol pathway